MTYGYEQALARRAAGVRPALQGGSGYFAARGSTLDPSLFVGDHLRSFVRAFVLSRFHVWCRQARLDDPLAWSQLWLAGSGITTAWDADRESNNEPGDLDTLVGVDYAEFTRLNPAFRGSRPDDIASWFNQTMHDELWPHTARTTIGHGVYELTFYVNPGVGAGQDDLLAINPYAAYNLNTDTWTKHPDEVPDGFSPDFFSADDRNLVVDDLTRAKDALRAFQDAQQQQHRHPHDIARLRALHDAVQQGATAFDIIHDGRKTAFAPGGKGYFDVANFRWQAAKGNGAITVLRTLKQLDEQAHKDSGPDCANIQHLLLTAALANGGTRFR